MPPLTSLSQLLLLATASSCALVHQYGRSSLTVVAAIAFHVAAVVLHNGPKDPTMTVMDRCLVNLDRLMAGKAPVAGQIASVMYFQGKNLPNGKAARATMRSTAEALPRFRSVAVRAASVEDSFFREVPGGVDALDMDGYHVVEHAAEATADDLERAVNVLINTEMDGDKPLWRIDIIPCKDSKAWGAVVMRMNHAMADGLRLVKAASKFATFEDGSPVELELLKKMSMKKLSAAKDQASSVNLFSFGLSFLKDFFTAATLDKMCAEDRTCFHEPDTLFRNGPRLNCTTSVEFAKIKKIKDSAVKGTTINDVVLAAFCGAARRYSLAVTGSPLPSNTLMRAFCAVSLPDAHDRAADDLYNDFIMPSMRLPVGADSPQQRLTEAHAVMADLKQSKVGWIIAQLSSVLARLGLDGLAGDTQQRLFGKHSFVYSNVPGYQKPAYLFGPPHKIERFATYYPNMISQLLFLSYCDQLTMSLSTDVDVVKKPKVLLECFVSEVNEWAAQC
jgi:hypothetical protein